MGSINIDIDSQTLSELNLLFGQLLLLPNSESIKNTIRKKFNIYSFIETNISPTNSNSDPQTESMLCSFLAGKFDSFSIDEERDWISALIQSEQYQVTLWSLEFCKRLSADEINYFRILSLFELGFYEDIISIAKKLELTKKDVGHDNVHSLYFLGLTFEKTGDKQSSQIIFEEINKRFPNYKSTYSKVLGTVFSIPR